LAPQPTAQQTNAQQRCKVSVAQSDLGVVGAPCIIWSTYGLQEGWKTKNVGVVRAHNASIRFQQKTAISIHENVVGYDEARP
ncbi:unnamed protein product, partial [Durusdinium trenchii]